MDPHRVFVPGRLPLQEGNAYVEREQLREQLEDNIASNFVSVVWGEYGVGKTTTVRRFLQDKYGDSRPVKYFSTAENMSMMDILEGCLERLDYMVERSVVTTDTAGTSLQLNAGFANGGGNTSGTQAVTTELLVKEPTASSAIEVLGDHGLILVVDEMHKSTPEFKREMASFIKASRAAIDDVVVILVGTVVDARELVALDPGIDRYIQEVQVGTMSAPEASQIAATGFARLGLHLDKDLEQRLITAASGAPTIVQYLCLNAAKAALKAGRTGIQESDMMASVDKYLEQHKDRLMNHFIKAAQNLGEKRYRSRILHAVATSESQYVTMEEIVASVSNQLGAPTPSTALSGPLKELKSDKRGRILSDVVRPDGERLHNVSTFTDPMMKSFVRFISNLDDSGLMPASDLASYS